MSSSTPQDDCVLLHVWMVDPQQADRHIRLLEELFARVADQPGFVSARILTSPDRSSIAALVEMGSADDRRQLEQHPAVRDALDRLRGSANLVARRYEVVAAVVTTRAPVRSSLVP